jgi:hypothetical protein
MTPLSRSDPVLRFVRSRQRFVRVSQTGGTHRPAAGGRALAGQRGRGAEPHRHRRVAARDGGDHQQRNDEGIDWVKVGVFYLRSESYGISWQRLPSGTDIELRGLPLRWNLPVTRAHHMRPCGPARA